MHKMYDLNHMVEYMLLITNCYSTRMQETANDVENPCQEIHRSLNVHFLALEKCEGKMH